MIAALMLLLLCVGGGFLFLHRRVRGRETELNAAIRATATARDKQMAAFHVRRFSDAIEQCDRPERLPELERNLRYWRAVASAEEMRP
jgi:hypothetical protein